MTSKLLIAGLAALTLSLTACGQAEQAAEKAKATASEAAEKTKDAAAAAKDAGLSLIHI